MPQVYTHIHHGHRARVSILISLVRRSIHRLASARHFPPSHTSSAAPASVCALSYPPAAGSDNEPGCFPLYRESRDGEELFSFGGRWAGSFFLLSLFLDDWGNFQGGVESFVFWRDGNVLRDGFELLDLSD